MYCETMFALNPTSTALNMRRVHLYSSLCGRQFFPRISCLRSARANCLRVRGGGFLHAQLSQKGCWLACNNSAKNAISWRIKDAADRRKDRSVQQYNRPCFVVGWLVLPVLSLSTCCPLWKATMNTMSLAGFVPAISDLVEQVATDVCK